MALWVEVKKAMKFPAVLNAYARAGGGAGNANGNLKKGFLKLVKAGGAWVRNPPSGAGVSKQDAQVDVTAIPGVPPLRKDGKRVAGVFP